jgi:soluble lytic murein transglycosylase-like protein
MKFSLATLALTGSVFAGISFTLYLCRPLPAHGTAIPEQVAAQPEKAPGPEPAKAFDVHAVIRAAAQKHQVPEALVKSIVAAESNFDQSAVSRTGAIGLMQLMPATAGEYSADPKIPEQNIDAGTRYLRCLIEKYRKSRNSLVRVIAAYNAGPGAVDKHRGVPPFRETRRYVVRVLGFLKQFQREQKQLDAVVRTRGDEAGD